MGRLLRLAGLLTLCCCLNMIISDGINFVKYNLIDSLNILEDFGLTAGKILCADKCIHHDSCYGFIYQKNSSCLSVGCTNTSMLEKSLGPGDGVYFPSSQTPYTELARDKPAFLSSTYNPDGIADSHDARTGNDGIYLPPLNNERLSLPHTNQEDKPWWRVDLLEVHCVWAVNILNRAFEGSGTTAEPWRKTKRVAVTVATKESALMYSRANTEVLCIYHEGELTRYYTLLSCQQPMRGRFVQIQLLVTNAYLNFYEIEIHGF